MWFVLLYYHIFFYSQVDHGFDTVYADDDNSDSDRVPGTDPEEESTDGGIHQLSICQLEPGGKDMMQCCYNSDAQSEVSEIIPNMNVTVQQPCTSGNLWNITVLKQINSGFFSDASCFNSILKRGCSNMINTLFKTFSSLWYPWYKIFSLQITTALDYFEIV